jgi:hypothetical protein
MSVLTDHPINGVITNLLAFAEDERIAKVEPGLPVELQAGLGRVFNFARLLRDLLERSAPEEVSLGGLNAVNSNLQQVYSEFSAFVGSGNQANLANALANLDNATNVFVWTFFNRPVKGAKPQFEAVESVRGAAEKAIASISARGEQFQRAVAATGAQLQGQNERIDQLNATLEEVRSGSTAAIASIQQQFSENLSAYRTEFDDLKTKFRSTQQEFSAEATQKAKDLIRELESQRDQAAKIVQVVGNIGVTGNYQKRAADEQTQANLWRGITLALFGSGVLLVTVNLILNFTGHVDLPTLIARFAIAVTVAIPALYTARESARHRTNADRAKQTELELASLSPFLEGLDATKRKEIIASLATSYFGQHVETHEVKAPVSLDEIQKTIASASEFVGKVKGA